MRFLPAVLLFLALASPSLAATGHVVPWHPQAWRPAPRVTAAASAGVRSDPVEPGSTLAPDLAAAMAAHRAALAAVPVVRRADGSRSAVLGGLARRWTVATLDGDGALHESCVTTEAQARALVEKAGKERGK